MPDGLRPGDAVWLRFPFSEPPKNKICVCVCVEENVFLIVSTRAYRFAPADSQLRIFEAELGILEYDSYIDVSKSYTFPAEVIAKGVAKGTYPLADSARARIKHAVETQPYLPERIKKKILENL